jgi:hypothetical protein
MTKWNAPCGRIFDQRDEARDHARFCALCIAEVFGSVRGNSVNRNTNGLTPDAMLAERAELVERLHETEADRDLWKRRCGEETRVWADEAAQVSALYKVIKEVAAYADDRAFHARGHLNTVNSGRIAADLRQILARLNDSETAL